MQNPKNLFKLDQLLCSCISGTKCDRQKLIFPAERRGQSVAPYDMDQIGLTITKTGGHHRGTILPCLSMGVPPPP